ncbi:MAG: hypothetical protein DRP84_08520 [Spirochaetes bacterium]|nr:MAG: hypothetical protein DRP84_08520 [Spirochaetota bacterium]
MNVLMFLSKEVLTDDRVYREAKALVDIGHKVTIIGWDRYHKYKPDEIYDGIDVVRIYNEGLMKILPNDLLRNPLWWRKAYKKALELNRYNFDIVHCHDLDTLQIGAWLKKKLNLKLIYDAHEIFAYMIKGMVTKIVVKTTFYLERRLIGSVDHIITVNEPLKNYFKSISDKPITVVMNCKDLISKNYISPKNDTFTLTYIGNLHRNRFFPELVDVVGNIKDVKLILAVKIGNRELYDEVMKRSERYSNIHFLGTIPSTDVLSTTLKGNAVIALMNPESDYAPIATMNKQFEAMVCGRPIIVTKGTYTAEMTEKLKCGLSTFYNAEAVKKTIEELRDDPELCEKLGRNALKAAVQKYNWENEKRKLTKVYEHIMN